MKKSINQNKNIDNDLYSNSNEFLNHPFYQLCLGLLYLKQFMANHGMLTTVEPLLSGHPRGMARWPFNRGGRLMEVCQIWTRI